jgi:RNA polymerase II subunit A small phosphatase-like protein
VTSSADRILLILDLDETLIYASEEPLERPADFRAYQYHVYRRPHLEPFLADCAAWFDLAIWSSASDLYVETVVANILPPEIEPRFVWGRSRATMRRASPSGDGSWLDPWDHLHYLKPLAKVKRAGWRLERVLIVDDTPAKCVRNYGNAVYAAPWLGSQEDDELPRLARYLQTLKDEPNVRTIEKRRWRDQSRPLA